MCIKGDENFTGGKPGEKIAGGYLGGENFTGGYLGGEKFAGGFIHKRGG